MSFDFPFKNTKITLCSVVKIMMIHKKNGSVVYSWIPLLTKIPVKIIMKTSPSIRAYTMLYILAVPAARRSVQNYPECQWDSTIHAYSCMHAYGNTHCTCQLSVCNIEIVVWGSGEVVEGGCCYDQGYTHNIIICYQVVLPYYIIMTGNLWLAILNSFSICIL